MRILPNDTIWVVTEPKAGASTREILTSTAARFLSGHLATRGRDLSGAAIYTEREEAEADARARLRGDREGSRLADASGPIRVSPAVYDGLQAVRCTGLTNMLYQEEVADIAEQMNYCAAARWVRENPGEYAQAVFRGLVTGGGQRVQRWAAEGLDR